MRSHPMADLQTSLEAHHRAVDDFMHGITEGRCWCRPRSSNPPRVWCKATRSNVGDPNSVCFEKRLGPPSAAT